MSRFLAVLFALSFFGGLTMPAQAQTSFGPFPATFAANVREDSAPVTIPAGTGAVYLQIVSTTPAWTSLVGQGSGHYGFEWSKDGGANWQELLGGDVLTIISHVQTLVQTVNADLALARTKFGLQGGP